MSDYHTRQRNKIVHNLDKNIICLKMGELSHKAFRELMLTDINNRISNAKSCKKKNDLYLVKYDIKHNWPEYSDDECADNIENLLLDLEISDM